jgi:predicted dehydrogenase
LAFRFLLVGLGNRGRQWADIVAGLPQAELAGAVDTDPARIASFSAKYPDVKTFSTLEAGIAGGDADAVLLATPPVGRLGQARAVFAAGLPLLAEKPLADSLGEAADIVRAAEAAGLPLSIGLNFRYLEVTRAIRDLVARQAFGAPGFGQFIYHRNRDGKRPGLNRYPLTMRHPMMLEQSIHHLDLIRFAYGREVASVQCRTWNPVWSMYAHDANVSCLLTLEDGMAVDYLGTWTGGWNELKFQWRTDCTGGVIVQSELFDDLATARTGDPDLTPVPLPACRAFVDDSRALLDAFVTAVGDKAPPPCSGRDHLRTLAVCWAALDSAATGSRVELAGFARRSGIEDLL